MTGDETMATEFTVPTTTTSSLHGLRTAAYIAAAFVLAAVILLTVTVWSGQSDTGPTIDRPAGDVAEHPYQPGVLECRVGQPC